MSSSPSLSSQTLVLVPPLTASQLQQILKRVGLSDMRPSTPTATFLQQLYLHFVCHIPFENLNFYRGKPVIMHFDAIFTKLITQHEGGCCYELHALFAQLLEALEFQTRFVPVFGNLNRDIDPMNVKFNQNSSHLNTIVTVGKEMYVCEIGLGSTSAPLKHVLDEVQTAPDGVKYRFIAGENEKWINLEVFNVIYSSWVPRFRVLSDDFDLNRSGNYLSRPFPDSFISGLSEAMKPHSVHQSGVLVAMMHTGDKYEDNNGDIVYTVRSLKDFIYVETSRGKGLRTERIERKLESEEAFREILMDKFRIPSDHWKDQKLDFGNFMSGIRPRFTPLDPAQIKEQQYTHHQASQHLISPK